MHVDRTKKVYNCIQIIQRGTNLWVNNLNNYSEENCEPSLGKKVVHNKTAKCTGWRKVQSSNSKGSSKKSTGGEEPQSRGQPKEFDQPMKDK